MATFQQLVKQAVGPRGYDNSMRRSLQTVVLYEAKRCIAPRHSSLRPFQRKLALLGQAQALVDSLDFLLPQHKEEVLWRTVTSKEPMTPEIAWKREKLIEKEMNTLCEKIKKHMAPGRSHDEAVNRLVQELYESVTSNTQPHPVNWEHAHNHVVFAYRLYFDGDQLDPNFPAAVLTREIVVPAQKPRSNQEQQHYIAMDSTGATIGGSKKKGGAGAAADAAVHDEPALDVSALIGEAEAVEASPVDKRRKVLQEVREHLDLLKEFEGVISAEELAIRKRDLFLALPSAPPPAAGGGAMLPSASKRAKV